MDTMTIKEASAKWGVTPRMVNYYCASGRVSGAVKVASIWLIPSGADKPGDSRRFPKNASIKHKTAELPRRNPFFAMSDLYHTPGSGDSVAASLADIPQAQTLFAAQLAYLRGEIDTAYEYVSRQLSDASCFDARVGAGILLSICAMYRGDVDMWRSAKRRLARIPCGNEAERDLLDFWMAFVDSSIYDATGFSEAFCSGCFDFLPVDCLAIARYSYVKHLYVRFTKSILEPPKGKDTPHRSILLDMLPFVCEPLISQTKAEGVPVAEIYLRLICAIAYHYIGNNDAAVKHINIAIALALPDRIYAPLAEYRRPLDFLLDDCLGVVSPVALKQVKALNKTLLDNWVKLHNEMLGRKVSSTLTVREREISRLASLGLSNKEIADRLHISVATVKQIIVGAMNKTGAKNRSELAHYV